MINKILAVLVLPVGIYTVLHKLKVYSLNLPFDHLLIAAILMIILQAANLLFAGQSQEKLSMMNVVTAIFFVLPAIAYLTSLLISFPYQELIPLFLGVLMIAESLYALH